MADTLHTKDGKVHVLLGSTTLPSLVRDYMGDEAARLVEAEIERNVREEARVETDLGSYEASLDHWHSAANDWLDEIKRICDGLRYHTKLETAKQLQELTEHIRHEL